MGVLNEPPEEGRLGQGSRGPGCLGGRGGGALPQGQACPPGRMVRAAPVCVIMVNWGAPLIKPPAPPGALPCGGSEAVPYSRAQPESLIYSKASAEKVQTHVPFHPPDLRAQNHHLSFTAVKTATGRDRDADGQGSAGRGAELESAGSVEFRRSPGLAGAPRASWGPVGPPPWGVSGARARGARGPGGRTRHAWGRSGEACTHRDPRLPGGGPALRGAAEGQACAATLVSHLRPGPERRSPAQEVGPGSSHWQVALSDWAMTLGDRWAPSSSQVSAEVTLACRDLFSKLA